MRRYDEMNVRTSQLDSLNRTAQAPPGGATAERPLSSSSRPPWAARPRQSVALSGLLQGRGMLRIFSRALVLRRTLLIPSEGAGAGCVVVSYRRPTSQAGRRLGTFPPPRGAASGEVWMPAWQLALAMLAAPMSAHRCVRVMSARGRGPTCSGADPICTSVDLDAVMLMLDVICGVALGYSLPSE
jgi:hypothetical protein